MYSKYGTFLLPFLCLILWLSLGSWVMVVPNSRTLSENSLTVEQSPRSKKVAQKKRKWSKRSKHKLNHPPNYGDRTQLSAFLLCLLLGFTGAHHFYLQNYKVAIIQLSLFVLFMALMFTNIIIGVTLAMLIGIGLFAWVMAAIFILIFKGLRTGKKKQLIPW